MNSFHDASSNQPDLILKLCNHFSKGDPGLAGNLCKIAFGFLSSASSAALNTPSDEQYTLVQIKQLLSSHSKDHSEQFDLLYRNLCKSNMVTNRCGVLRFLLALSKNSQEQKWTTMESLEKFPAIARPKSNLILKSSNSQDSIRSIFQGQNNVRSMQSSVTNLQSARSTTESSAIWTNNGLDLVSPASSMGLSLINEKEILRDIIYSFQGIEGEFLRKEPGGLGYFVDAKYEKNLNPIQRSLIDRLTGTSFLHNHLQQYCDTNDKQSGIICLALIATLREELADYYKTVALLQTALTQPVELNNARLTLRKCLVYIHDHHARFEWLAYIAEQCNDKKGGALITAVHGFLQHGSQCAQQVLTKVLTAVCKPFYVMLSRWLLDGEINDPSNEFFIEARNVTAAERLWYDKYYVRKSMVPSFITMEQAKQILATGKSINFLKQICKDPGQLPGREALENMFKNTSADVLFAPEQSLEFHSTLEKFYKETALRVLDLLKNKYRLFEHLQSLRRYLLLGQGDFIRHLLELLVPELNKEADQIYSHTLSAILETAIRVTSAQFEDEDTLARLNVSFMGHSRGDKGWDVFSLIYVVDGPVGTIFQPTMTTYQCLFGALWKAKRMELVLANMRKQMIASAKKFRKIRELKPVMHGVHILTSAMIHFLHQTQYYFLFEVLECSWAEMLKQVNQAECLDDVINAHTTFLNSVQAGVLLDENSKSLLSHLRSIYNVILTLETHQEVLNTTATEEHEAYTQYRKKCEAAEDFLITHKDKLEADRRVAIFHQFLNDMKTKVRHLAQTYQQFVKEYLKLLASSSNMNLQLLSVRLNFNDYYQVI